MNEVVSPDELPDSTADFAFQDVESREIRIALASLLDELSPIEKRLLFLRFCQGLTAREISGRVGFSTAFHVYRSLDSVLKKLRFALAAKGYDGFRLVDDVA